MLIFDKQPYFLIALLGQLSRPSNLLPRFGQGLDAQSFEVNTPVQFVDERTLRWVMRSVPETSHPSCPIFGARRSAEPPNAFRDLFYQRRLECPNGLKFLLQILQQLREFSTRIVTVTVWDNNFHSEQAVFHGVESGVELAPLCARAG